MSIGAKEYIWLEINRGTAREKTVELISAINLNAKITEHKHYFIVEIQDKLVALPSIVPNDCIRALCDLKADTRVRIYFGDLGNGRCDVDEWNLKHDNGRINLRNYGGITEGYLSPSWSPPLELRQINNYQDVKAHLLTIYHYATGMYMFPSIPKMYLVRPETIVRIEHSNKKYGGVIWSHPEFHLNEDILFSSKTG